MTTPTPPPLPQQTPAQTKKRGCLIIALILVAAFFGVMVLLAIIGSLLPSSEQKTADTSAGAASPAATAAASDAPSPEAKLDYTFDDIDGYGLNTDEMKSKDAKIQEYSDQITKDVYKIASTRPEVTKIVIRINCRFPAETNVTDYYGHEHSRPAETAFAKEIVVDDVDDVRRYTKSAYKEHQPFFSELYQDLVRAERQSPWEPPWPEEH
jgi:hypothetical protein